jgi:hypothetical protein
MPGKVSQLILRNVVAKVIERKKWVEVGFVPEADCAAQMHTRAIARRFGSNEAFHRTYRHTNELPAGGAYSIARSDDNFSLITSE